MFWLGWSLFAGVIIGVVPPTVWFVVRRLRRLPDQNGNTSRDIPAVSLIVPARNEQDTVEAALRSMLKSEYPRLQVVVVNDRSTDRTGEIIESVAANDNRCTVLHIQELPEGWLGKNHAMHLASQKATGDYLLFSDADVVYEPGTIEAAVTRMQQDRLQHLCLLPRMIPGSVLENCIVSFLGFAFIMGQQVHLLRRHLSISYAGVGAFNMIEAACYREIGGHTKIAMDVVDDVKLGKMVKRSGGRQDFLRAPEFLSLRWYSSLSATIKGLEKNAFAAVNYSVRSVVLASTLFLAGMIAPYFVPAFLSPTDASGFLATIVVWNIMFGLFSRSLGCSFFLMFCFPIAAFLLFFAIWNSTWVTLRQRGVCWRDSRYDLEELKAGLYR